MAYLNLLFRPLFKQPLSIIRIWVGLAFIMHGLPGIFSADYMAGHQGMVEMYNVPLPQVAAYLSKGGELLAGILLLLGLFTRVGAGIVILNMLVATFLAMRGDIFGDYQAQISFTYLIAGLALFLSGPTAFSLDQRISERQQQAQIPPAPTPVGSVPA